MAYTWINTTKYGVLVIGAILLCYVYGGYIKDIMESIPGELFNICTRSAPYYHIQKFTLRCLATLLHMTWWYYILL